LAVFQAEELYRSYRPSLAREEDSELVLTYWRLLGDWDYFEESGSWVVAWM
jgi:hypothetical protein